MRKFLTRAGHNYKESVHLLCDYTFSATVRIRIFYVFLAFFAVSHIHEFFIYKDVTDLETLWPVYWLNFFGEAKPYVIRGLMAFSLIGSILGALFCQYRSFRIIAFLSLIQYMGLKYSFGKTGHSLHLYLIIAFLFLFLPKNWQQVKELSKKYRYHIFMLFKTAQAMILCTYGMAGLGKIGGVIYQVFLGQSHALSPDALELHISDRLLQTSSNPVLGAWLIENTTFNFVMMPIAIFVQLFSFIIIFNPKWQKYWAGLLIGTHVFNSLALGINFHPSVFLLGLFFF